MPKRYEIIGGSKSTIRGESKTLTQSATPNGVTVLGLTCSQGLRFAPPLPKPFQPYGLKSKCTPKGLIYSSMVVRAALRSKVL